MGRIVYSVSRSLRLPAVLATAVGTAEAAVLLLRPSERAPAAVKASSRAYFSADELDTVRRFRRGQLSLLGARSALELGLLAVASARAGRAAPPGRRRLRPAPRGRASRLFAGGPPAGAATAAALTMVTTVAGLPLSAWSRRRAQAVGLVTQPWRGWAADMAKQAAVSGAFASAGGALLVAGTQRFGRGWWAPGAAAVVATAAGVTMLGPVALDPLFNRFTPLPDGDARRDVLALAARSGVDVGEVYEVDASRRTTAANAYVTGLGRTKRVVLFDTLLEHFSPGETRLVVAHELSHVRHRDVAHGLLWLALAAPAGLLAAAELADALAPGRLGTAAVVPAVALALSLVAPVLGVVANQLSRAVELRADREAVALTGETEALIAFERRITLRNVADPDPPRWLQVLLGTHPTTMERIGQALALK